MGARAIFVDRPFAVTSLIVAGVAVHSWATSRWDTIPDMLALTRAKDVQALYLGTSGIGAMLAGFSGVVLVFAMGQGVRRLTNLRVRGGGQLRANWLSPVASSFGVAFLSAAAAVSTYLGHASLGVWVFEVAALMALHAATRMLLLLRALVNIVGRDDADAARRGEPVDVAALVAASRSRAS